MRITSKKALLAGGTAVVAVVALTASGGSDEDRADLVAYFADASPLEIGSQIRASGVRVGTVGDIELDGSEARVELKLDDAVLPVRKDAQLTIKPVNLLGETYIDLDQGSPDQPALEGDVPVAQTGSAVTLQNVLDTFDDPAAAGLAGLVTTLGQGMQGNGDEMASAIRALAPAMLEAEKLGAILDDQNGVLAALVDQSAPVARAVSGKNGAELDRLLAATTETLTAINAQSAALKSTIANLPGALTEAEATLDELATVGTRLTPVIRELRPVTKDLEEISGEITAFSGAVNPAMDALQPVLAEARKVIGTVTPVVKALRESGDDLVATAAAAESAGDVVLGTHLDDVMTFVRKWSLATNSRDALSHYFRGVLHVTPMALDTLLGTDAGSGTPTVDLPTNPLVDQVTDLLKQIGPVDRLGPATAGDSPIQLDAIEDTLEGIDAAAEPEDPTSATGLSALQELDLLEQLLGGLR